MPYTDQQIIASVDYLSLKLSSEGRFAAKTIKSIEDMIKKAIGDVLVFNPDKIIIGKNQSMFFEVMQLFKLNDIDFPSKLEIMLTRAGESFDITSGAHIVIYSQMEHKKKSTRNLGVFNAYTDLLGPIPKHNDFLDHSPGVEHEMIFMMDEDLDLNDSRSNRR